MRVAKITLFLMLAALVGQSVGCSSPPAYEPIPVEDARALNTRVGQFYDDTREILEDSAFEVTGIAPLPDNVRPQDFELDLVKGAMMDCFDDRVEVTEVTIEAPRGVDAEVSDDPMRPLTARTDLGNVRPCDPSDLISLESYLDVTPAHIRELIIERMLMVDGLRVNLKHVSQERLNLLEEYALDTRAEAASLRDVSRQRYENTLANPEVSDAQRRQTEADYEVIQDQFDQIDRLCDDIEDELSEMRRFRRQLVEDVSVEIASMGTPGS